MDVAVVVAAAVVLRFASAGFVFFAFAAAVVEAVVVLVLVRPSTAAGFVLFAFDTAPPLAPFAAIAFGLFAAPFFDATCDGDEDEGRTAHYFSKYKITILLDESE